MPRLLHILTRPGDAFAQEMISRQKGNPAHQVEVIDLTEGPVDYQKLLEKIFAADSVQSW